MSLSDGNRAGWFLSFEGGEGTGKTTQICRLRRRLQEAEYQVVVTREPGGTEIGRRIRKILLTAIEPENDMPSIALEEEQTVLENFQRPHALSEALLFSFDRLEHLQGVIRPALQAGKHVLCDRFADSTLAYQGYAQGKDIEKIAALNKLVVGETWPDLTFVFDLSEKICLERAHGRGEAVSYFEKKKLGFHQELRRAFLQIARDESHRCVVIDAERSIDQISRDIAKICHDRLGMALS